MDGDLRRRHPQPCGRDGDRRGVRAELHLGAVDVDRGAVPRAAARDRRLRHAPQGGHDRQAGCHVQFHQVRGEWNGIPDRKGEKSRDADIDKQLFPLNFKMRLK